MIHVVQTKVVSDALERLRGQGIHELFAGYLCLLQTARESGRFEDLMPEFRDFFGRYFFVRNHPVGTPYVKPFIYRKPSTKNLWLNENVAGSYAPSSLRADKPFRKLVDISSNKKYSLLKNHAQLAFEHLLGAKKVAIADLAVFLYRDFGLLGSAPSISDLIDVFAVDFGFADKPSGPRNKDFHTLFTTEKADQIEQTLIDVSAEHSDTSVEVSTPGIHPRITSNHVRNLEVQDLLHAEKRDDHNQPPFQEVRITGLLSFGEETVFEFGRLNILVGPNGSGKSNLIDCLRVFREAPRDIQQAFASGGFEAWLYNGLDKKSGSGVLQAIVRVPEISDAIRHQVRLGPPNHSRAQLEELVNSAQIDEEQPDPYFVGSYQSPAVLSSLPISGKRRHKKQLGSNDYNPFRSILSQVRDVGQYPEITHLASLYSSFRIYSEWSFGRESKLREAAPTGRSDARLSESMSDLPVALNALEQTPAHEEILRLLKDLKETYVDYVTRILFGRVGLEIAEKPFKLPVPANRLSDGTLRFLALAAILLQPDPPPVICLEEPELGMHPDMIRMVAGMMIEASTRTQLIVTTHSEHLLTALQDDFDALFAFDVGLAGTVVRRFGRQDFEDWRKEHPLGELWTSGELGGNRW